MSLILHARDAIDDKILLLLAVTLMHTRLSEPERPIKSIDGYVVVILPVFLLFINRRGHM
jgi:hypothetical protein